jgi:hypothetical protein
MDIEMKARKTEYRYVTFASKSEARVALLMDNHGINWWYQPPSLALPDGYVPDFMVVSLSENIAEEECPQACNFGLELTIVEYKPKRPTQVYLRELAERFKAIGNLLHSEKTVDMLVGCVVNCSFVVLTGGMGYEKAACLPMSWGGPDAPMRIPKTWRPSWEYLICGLDVDAANKRLSGYRFDLVSP